jgi:hypothetical protein
VLVLLDDKSWTGRSLGTLHSTHPLFLHHPTSTCVSEQRKRQFNTCRCWFLRFNPIICVASAQREFCPPFLPYRTLPYPFLAIELQHRTRSRHGKMDRHASWEGFACLYDEIRCDRENKRIEVHEQCATSTRCEFGCMAHVEIMCR